MTMVITKNTTIHAIVETKPKYTSCSIIPQPRINRDRIAVVACVSGKQYDIHLQFEQLVSKNLIDLPFEHFSFRFYSKITLTVVQMAFPQVAKRLRTAAAVGKTNRGPAVWHVVRGHKSQI